MKKTAKKPRVTRAKSTKASSSKGAAKTIRSPRKLVKDAALKAQALGQDFLDRKLLAIADRSIKSLQTRTTDLSAQALDQTVHMGERVLQRVKQARKAMTSRSGSKKARR